MKKALLSILLLAFGGGVAGAYTRVGNPPPAFTLTDINGKTVSLSDYKGKFVVLEWTNPSCPFVKKHYSTGNMQTLQKDMTGKGVIWLTIASSAKGKEGYFTAVEWKKIIEEKKSSSTTTLLDEDGAVGRAYEARTTPHMFIINPDGILIYSGAIDDKPTFDKEDVRGARNFVREALEQAMAGKRVGVPHTKSYGCSIKY